MTIFGNGSESAVPSFLHGRLLTRRVSRLPHLPRWVSPPRQVAYRSALHKFGDRYRFTTGGAVVADAHCVHPGVARLAPLLGEFPRPAALAFVDRHLAFVAFGRDRRRRGRGRVAAAVGRLSAGVRAMTAAPGWFEASTAHRALLCRHAIITRRRLVGGDRGRRRPYRYGIVARRVVTSRGGLLVARWPGGTSRCPSR